MSAPESRRPVFRIHTFGCKTNQYESQALARALGAAGWTDAADAPAGARVDVAVVNTCAVTAHAESAARRKIRALAERGVPVVLTGCAASLLRPIPSKENAVGETSADGMGDPPERAPKYASGSAGRNVGEAAEGRVLVLANVDKARLAERLAAFLSAPEPPPPAAPGASGTRPPLPAAASSGDGSCSPAVADPRFALSVDRFDGHARALLKIQDGCANACAYCVVPRLRGAPASRPADEVVAEALRLAAAGHREIGLTGIHIGAYRDEGGLTLARRLVRLAAALAAAGHGPADGDRAVRLRLGSVEPTEATDELLDAMAARPDAICPHLHLPLQSGDDATLARMGRRYRAEDFLAAVARIRAALPDPALAADVIVGFPGEDDDAFARTRAVCAAAGLSRGHVFPFSERPGTPAGDRPEAFGRAVPRPVREARRAELAAWFDGEAARFAARWIGRTVLVVAERPGADATPPPLAARLARGGVRHDGYTDRYIRVRFAAPTRRVGARVAVGLLGADGGALWGEAEDSVEVHV